MSKKGMTAIQKSQLLKRLLIALLMVVLLGFVYYCLPQILHPEKRQHTVMKEPASILESTVLTPVNSSINEDLEVTVLSGDPQLVITGYTGDTGAFRICFREAIPAGTSCQLFYLTPENDLNEQDSVTIVPDHDTTFVLFSLPDTFSCWAFRLDIDTNYAIEDLEVSPVPAETITDPLLPYLWENIIQPNLIIHLAITLLILVLAFMTAYFWNGIYSVIQRLNRNKVYLSFSTFTMNLFAGALMFRMILLGGHTNLTAEAYQSLSWIATLIWQWEKVLACLLLAMEMLKSWKRAVFCTVMLVFYYLLPNMLNTPVLVEMFLLAGFSNLSSRKGIVYTWLLVHVGYAVLLAVLHSQGMVTDALTSAKKHFFILPSLDRGTSLGTIHPNTPGIWLMSMMMVLWLEWQPRHWWITLISFWAGAVLVWGITMNRTVTAVMLLFPFLSYVISWLGNSNRKRKILYCTVVLPFLCVGIVWFMWRLSGTLSSRFGDGAFWIRFTEWDLMVQYGVRPFGLIPPVKLWLDNLYMWLIISCGLIPAAFTLLCYSGMNAYLTRSGNYSMLAVAVAYLFYSIMEHALVYPVFFALPLIVFCRPSTISIAPLKRKPDLQM